jgi:methionine synthase II (cobalamin-independent)
MNETKCRGVMLAGACSRSEKTSIEHRLFRDGHSKIGEFNNAIAQDSAKYLQAQSNFAYVSGGQLDWLDLLRPIANSFEGFSKRGTSGEDAIGPVTRYFRTNSFFRKPTVIGKIFANGNELVSVLPIIPKNGLLFLLGPYSFIHMIENNFYSDNEKLASDYVRAIVKNYPSLKKHGYSAILLLEPYIGYDQSKGSLKIEKWYSRIIGEMKKEGMIIGIHLPLCDASQLNADLDATPVDFIGIDAIYTAPEKLNTKKDLLFGIIDGGRARKESVFEMNSILKSFLEKSTFSGNYFVGPNDRLFDVPFKYALEKIKSLSDLRGELK